MEDFYRQKIHGLYKKNALGRLTLIQLYSQKISDTKTSKNGSNYPDIQKKSRIFRKNSRIISNISGKILNFSKIFPNYFENSWTNPEFSEKNPEYFGKNPEYGPVYSNLIKFARNFRKNQKNWKFFEIILTLFYILRYFIEESMFDIVRWLETTPKDFLSASQVSNFLVSFLFQK